MNRDILTVWRDNGFILLMWDTHRQDWRGQTVIGFKLWDNGKLIFNDEGFAGSPLHADDSIETVAGLLAFLSLQLGDTDTEYFDDYTPTQLAWLQTGRAEGLAALVYDLEHKSA